MAQASVVSTLRPPPDQVWQLIGGFNSLPNWLPYIPKSELSEGGRVRHLANRDGQTIVERSFQNRQKALARGPEQESSAPIRPDARLTRIYQN